MTPARLAAAACALAAAAALSGCTAGVESAITVTGAQKATVTVTATFTDEAAQAINADPASLTQLEGVFTDATGTRPHVTQSKDRVVVTSDLTYTQLRATGPVTGVAAAAMKPAGGDVALTVDLAAPTRLVQAVRASAASQPDAGPLATTMLRATSVDLAVTFPGGITSATGAAHTVKDNTVRVHRTADSAGAGTITVVGDPTPSRLPWVLGGSAVLAAAVVVAARRRR